MDYQEIIAGTVGKENTYGTLSGRVKASAMTFARFSTDDVTGRMRGYVGSGAFTNDPLEYFRRDRRGGDFRSAAPAALHLREWVRAPRRRQPVEFGRGGA